MSKERVFKSLMLSPVFLGIVGLAVGYVCSSPHMVGLMWVGICLGSFIGFVAAVRCLVSNSFKCANIAALCVNLVVFIVVGKEMFFG